MGIIKDSLYELKQEDLRRDRINKLNESPIMYRGEKDIDKPNGSVGLYGKGKYFTNKEDSAKRYGVVNKYDVNLKNPFIIEDGKESIEDTIANLWPEYEDTSTYSIFTKLIKEPTEILKEKGYDGVIVKFPNSDECYYISFDKDNYKLLEGLNNNYDKVVYRVDTYEGDKSQFKNQSVFFSDSLDYFDKSLTGYKKEDAKKYYLNLKDFKVWNPIKELNLDAATWAVIWGKVKDFDKYGIYWETSEDVEDLESIEYAFTSTDDLAEAGKNLGYDITILENIPNDGGWGKYYTEYAVHNSNAIKSEFATKFDKNDFNTMNEGNKLAKEQSEFFNRIDENLQPFELEKEKNRIRDVLDIMKDVQYGFISKKDGKPITDREWIHNNDLSDYYEVNKDPNKTINDKLGICQDQSIAIKYLMNKYHPEDEVVLYGVTKSPKGHCVPCYCHEGKWYYIENSWDKEKGLHGYFDSQKELEDYLKYVYYENHKDDTPKENEVKVREYKLDEKIVKKGSKYQVQSEKGKNMGTYNTKKEAKKRLGQIEYFKNLNESEEKPLPTLIDILKYKNHLPFRFVKSNNFTDRCFICDDGKFVNTFNKPHYELEEWYRDYIAEKYNIRQWLINNNLIESDHAITQRIFNWVRVNSHNEYCIILPPESLTKEQSNSLYEWLKDYYSKMLNTYHFITIVTSDGQQQKFDLLEYDEDDIMTIVNRFYNNGLLLTESVNESLSKSGNCISTFSALDVANLFTQKPKFYRVIYDALLGEYFIGEDSYNIIHQNILTDAIKSGAYDSVNDLLDMIEDGDWWRRNMFPDTYWYYGVDGVLFKDLDKDLVKKMESYGIKNGAPWLCCMVFEPNDELGTEFDYSSGGDYYNYHYIIDTGIIHTRYCELEDFGKLQNYLDIKEKFETD